MLYFMAITLPLPALLAYVGPGPGLSMMWALIGLFATLLAALFAIACWPLRVMMRKRRERRERTVAVPVDR